MANTITFSLTADATSPVPTTTQNWTISDEDLQSLLNWAQTAFAPFIQTTFNGGSATVAGSNPPQPFVPTNQQIVQGWIGSLLQSTVQAVQQHNMIPASVPPPIAVTPA